jgi:hypothetical protein
MPINENPEILQRFAAKANVFIETGTYEGHGVQAAAIAGFTRLHSFEIDREKHKTATERLAKLYGAVDCLDLHFGDSVKGLEDTLRVYAAEYPSDRIVCFLDAHHVAEPVPLLFELDVIRRFHQQVNAVLIDDMRLIHSQIDWGRQVNPLFLEVILSTMPGSWKRYSLDDWCAPADIHVLERNETLTKL